MLSLFLTGTAQRALLRFALEHVLDAKVSIEEASLWGQLRASRLELREPGASPKIPPAIIIEGFVADYALFAPDRRHVRRLTMDRLAVTLADVGPGATNYDFLRRFLAAPSSGIDPLLATPVETAIRRIDFRNSLGDFPVDIENLAFFAHVASLEDLSCRVSGNPAQVQWQFGNAPDSRDGDLDLSIQRQGTVWFFQGQAAIPEFFDLDAQGSLQTTGARPELVFDAKRLTLWGLVLAAAGWRDTPVPVRFERMDLSGSHAAGTLPSKGQSDNIEATLNVRVKGLQVGAPPNLWYDGDIVVSGAGGLGEDAAFEGAITLNAGQEVRVAIHGGTLSGSAKFSMSEWLRPQIGGLVPEAYRPYLDYVPSLERLTGALEFAWGNEGITWKGALTPALSSGADVALGSQGSVAITDAGTVMGGKLEAVTRAQTITLSGTRAANGAFTGAVDIRDVALDDWAGMLVSGALPANVGGNLNGTGEFSMTDTGAALKLALRCAALSYGPIALPGERDVHFTGMATLDTTIGAIQGGPIALDIVPDAALRVEEWSALTADPVATFQGTGTVTLRNADVRGWCDATGLLKLPEGLSPALDGEIIVTANEYDWRFKANLAATGLQGESWSIPELAPRLTGTAAASRDFSEWHSTEFHLALTDTFEVSLRDCEANLPEGAARASLHAEGDVTFLGALLGAPDLWGEVSIEAPVRFEKGLLDLETALTTDTLGFGDLAVPYGETLRVEGACRYATGADTLGADTLAVTLGENTRLTAERVSLGLSPSAIQVDEFRFATDFAPFVAMEYLADATGSAELTGTFGLDDSGMRGRVQGVVRAERITLPGATAEIENLDASGGIILEDQFSGNIVLSMAAVSIGEVRVSSIQTTLHPEGTRLRSDNVRASVFGGAVDATIAVGVLEAGMPILLDLKLSDIDLEQFTNEYKPPGVTLTGRASGSVAIAFLGGGLSDLTVDLQAGDGFSMNRDMVEQLLLSQYLPEMPMGKSFERMLRRTIGKKPQRAFDSATLELGFAEGRIVGKALLDSKDLALDVDIKADPKAVIEALRARGRP